MLQSIDGQQRVVDCPHPVGGNQDDFAAQFCDQIQHRKALAQRHQQTADSFDEQTFATAGHSPDSAQNVRQADGAAVSSSRDQGSQRLRKMKGSDLVERQVTVLNRTQEFRVGPAAGAERFHRERVATTLPQVVEQQAGQEGLADAGVGAGNEDNAGVIGSVHGRQ